MVKPIIQIMRDETLSLSTCNLGIKNVFRKIKHNLKWSKFNNIVKWCTCLWVQACV